MKSKNSKRFPVIILMYHAVVRTPLEVFDWCFITESKFEAQLDCLMRTFNIVPLAAVPRLLRSGPARPTAAITFDDGFLNNFEVALPILRRASVPAAVFICPDFVDSEEILWYCRLNRALAETPLAEVEWNGALLDLSSPQARALASSRLQAELKGRSPSELLENVEEILKNLRVPERKPETDSPYRMLTSTAIRSMQETGLIAFGAHTMSHAILRQLPSTERRTQIEASIAAVEKLSRRRCNLFAYPNGQASDYDEECIRIVAAAGIDAAVTAIPGFNNAQTPVLELRRFGVGGDLSTDDFQSTLEDARRPLSVSDSTVDRLISKFKNPITAFVRRHDD
jgi:peptidoglycan/xylan/chitin deacetylase (PgdA/CDA1 family)